MTDEEDVAALKSKLNQLEIKLSNQLHEIKRLREEEAENRVEIAELQKRTADLMIQIQTREIELQDALNKSSTLATKNSKLQSEFATMVSKTCLVFLLFMQTL